MKPLKLPFPIRAWNAGNSLISNFRKEGKLEVDRLLHLAIKAEGGLKEFGGEAFLEPLNRLIDSINQEAELHAFGRFVTQKRLIGLLRNRLRAEFYFQKYPEILDIDIEAPLVIAGLQRTGTTFLQRLLASNPDIRSLKSWEALNPAPFQGWSHGQTDPRVNEGKKAEKGLRYLNPSFFAIHPVEYDAPEEEVLLLDISFLSTVAEATLNVPSFAKWLEKEDQTPAYLYMKKLLQLLTWQNPGRKWVLKTPHHLEHLHVLRKVFPGCTIIQTHRDPKITVPSLCSMIWHGRFIFSDQVDAESIGKQWLRKVQIMMERSTKFRESVNGENFIDLSYHDLIKKPVEQVGVIYEAMGTNFSDEKKKLLERSLNLQRKDRFGTHKYRPEDFGLSEGIIRDRLRPYLK